MGKNIVQTIHHPAFDAPLGRRMIVDADPGDRAFLA